MRKEEIFTFVLFFISWLIISGDLAISSLFVGVIVSLLLTFVIKSKATNVTAWIIIIRSVFIIIYLLFLIVEAFVSSCRVAYLTLHPKLPLKTGIIKVSSDFNWKTKIMSMTLLANSITLTPGTLTIDLDTKEQDYYIHWIDMEELEGEELKEEIFGPIEAIIRRIFK
ncbi:Na+/H+ antiporter subunit E [Halonatronum saccharophilum]|uniref:Na+/H+ antiporter subunit E n=1 Tax=Halonatronum saccharophilum TaxID=150060 RepID=UPI00047FC6E0|nr:Na+/H+ antiporter subunit E [Halonatronum saccharophilum]